MGETMLALVTTLLPVIEAGALVIARPLGFVVIFPVFAWMGLQGMVRNMTALVIGLPLLATVYGQIVGSQEVMAAEYIAVLAGKEFLVGIVLGVLLGAPFWAAEIAGGYVDVYRGAMMSTVNSPDFSAQPTISGGVFALTLIAIFIIIGGLRIAIGAIYDSYTLWPIFEVLPNISGPLSPLFIELLGKIFRIGLALGAPIIIAMFLGDLALSYASRFAQQINVFDASLSAKNLIYIFMMPPYLYLLTTVYGEGVLDIPGLMAIIERMVSP